MDWGELAQIQRDMQFTRLSVQFDWEQHERAVMGLGLMMGSDGGAVRNLFSALTLTIRLRNFPWVNLLDRLMVSLANLTFNKFGNHRC